jgi:hypothetical protein
LLTIAVIVLTGTLEGRAQSKRMLTAPAIAVISNSYELCSKPPQADLAPVKPGDMPVKPPQNAPVRPGDMPVKPPQ